MLPVLSFLLNARFPPYDRTKIQLIRMFAKPIMERFVNPPLTLLARIAPLFGMLFVLFKMGLRVSIRFEK